MFALNVDIKLNIIFAQCWSLSWIDSRERIGSIYVHTAEELIQWTQSVRFGQAHTKHNYIPFTESATTGLRTMDSRRSPSYYNKLCHVHVRQAHWAACCVCCWSASVRDMLSVFSHTYAWCVCQQIINYLFNVWIEFAV